MDNNNEKKEKYKCLFFILNELNKDKDNVNDNQYIHSSKFISNNSFIITKDKTIHKYYYSYNSTSNSIDSINIQNEFKEKDFIYDYDIINNNDQNESDTNICSCICSKDNPIRILDDKLSLIKSFSIENKQKDAYLSSIFIKYESFGLNIYTGKNHLSKIDLIKQKEAHTIYNKNYNYLSCFDFNIKYSCYFLGSYSNKLIMCDYKTDKIINIYKQNNSVNQLQLLNTKEYKLFVGYRNADYIQLYDIRKMNKYLCKLERNALTTKKINFILDNTENNLYSGTVDGKILKISEFDKADENNNVGIINKEEIDIGINNCISSIDINNDYKLLIITNGDKNYYDEKFYSINDNLDIDSDDNSEIIKNNNESQFHIYKIIDELN